MSSLLDTLSAVRQNVSTTFRAALDPFKAAHGESSGPRDTTPALANRVFGYRHAHTRIKSVLGKELSTGQTVNTQTRRTRGDSSQPARSLATTDVVVLLFPCSGASRALLESSSEEAHDWRRLR